MAGPPRYPLAWVTGTLIDSPPPQTPQLKIHRASMVQPSSNTDALTVLFFSIYTFGVLLRSVAVEPHLMPTFSTPNTPYQHLPATPTPGSF